LYYIASVLSFCCKIHMLELCKSLQEKKTRTSEICVNHRKLMLDSALLNMDRKPYKHRSLCKFGNEQLEGEDKKSAYG